MEAERLYTKQPSRTIQQKRGGEGALEMVDNRPAGILQAMSERPIQRVEDVGHFAGQICTTNPKNGRR